IPTIDTDLLLLSKYKERFISIGTWVIISSPAMVSICRDKNLTSQFFIECGLKAPMPVDDWKKYQEGFPAFLKPKDGSSSINAYKVQNMQELKFYADKVDNYIVQPFANGKEYTIDIFCDWDGNPLSIVPRERIRVRAGEVLITRIFMDKKMIEEAEVICDRFRPCGPLTVQLIRDQEGIDWFIEINPRYGGGVPLSIKAGGNSPEAIMKLMAGEPVEYMGNIAEDTIYSRFDQSICVSEGKRCMEGVIFDLDDTLYSEKDYVRSGYKAVSDYFGGGHEDQLWTWFCSGKPAIDELLKEIGQEMEKERVLQIYRTHKPEIKLYEGVRELLIGLRESGKKLGIITDGRPEGQRNKIEALKLSELVDDIIVTDELGGKQFRKPCDIAFRIMQTKWRMDPSKIVYIGDNPNKDFQAPRQLGMSIIYFANKNGIYSNNNDGRNMFVNRIESLKDLLL
ncbi:MAG: ATP-grasp domain-containing protein, partial [Parasporobacterium sp.]|nr:ATP-grasp domain-containing protein [Parasporobacterium sp.]